MASTLSLIQKILVHQFSGSACEFDPQECTVGTHTLRKTGYMYAVFGILYRYESTGRRRTDMAQPGLTIQPLEDDALNKSARHKSQKQAALYYQNCLSQWEDSGFHRPECWPEYKVSPWKSVFYSSGKFNRKNPNASTRTSKSVSELAKWYVKEALDCRSSFDWQETYQLSLGRKGHETPFEKLRHLFDKFQDDRTRVEATRLFGECFKKSLELEAEQKASETESERVSVSVDGMPQLVTPEFVRYRARGRDDDEEQRREKKKQRNQTREQQRAGPVEEQVSLESDREELATYDGSNMQVYYKMREITVRYEGKNKGFVPRDYQWLKRLRGSVARIDKCILECSGGEPEVFFDGIDKLNRISYKCVCNK